jgi:hypothetical protein
VDADYLYWKIKDSPEPVKLVIEQPDQNCPFTTVLGDKKMDLGWRSGAKFGLGGWFDDTKCFGAEANYFFLSRASKRSSISSDDNGSPALRVPFFDVQTDLEDSSPLATPGLYRGSAWLKVDNRMQGAELNLLGTFCTGCDSLEIQWFGGFRWWNFQENLKFFANSPIINPPSIYNYNDSFRVKNNFYGGQLGASFNYNYCSFSFNLAAKVALGAMNQKTKVDGFFTTNEFTGKPMTFLGGFFALPTNIGHHKKTHFSALPELDINIGYQFTDCLKIRFGYSLLYVSKVLWAGKQIDRNLNPSQSANIDFTPNPMLVGEPSPRPRTKSESLWAQGFNVGIEVQF